MRLDYQILLKSPPPWTSWLDPPLVWCDHCKPPLRPVRMRSTLLPMRSHKNDHVISTLGSLVLTSREQKGS